MYLPSMGGFGSVLDSLPWQKNSQRLQGDGFAVGLLDFDATRAGELPDPRTGVTPCS